MMTLKEATNLVALALANFPGMQDKDMRPTAKLWMQMLSDVPYQIAEKALLKVLSTAKFFPAVAELREAVAEFVTPDALSAPEAWGLVLKTIHSYGYYREAEALATIPPEVAEIVKWMGWQELCHSDNVDVIRAQFMRMYETQATRRREADMLPPSLAETTGKLKFIGGGGVVNHLAAEIAGFETVENVAGGEL